MSQPGLWLYAILEYRAWTDSAGSDRIECVLDLPLTPAGNNMLTIENFAGTSRSMDVLHEDWPTFRPRLVSMVKACDPANLAAEQKKPAESLYKSWLLILMAPQRFNLPYKKVSDRIRAIGIEPPSPHHP